MNFFLNVCRLHCMLYSFIMTSLYHLPLPLHLFTTYYSETLILYSLHLRFHWLYVSSLLNSAIEHSNFEDSLAETPQFYAHFHLWSFRLTSVMTDPVKLASKTCDDSVATMNSTNKTSVRSIQAKLCHNNFVWTLVGKGNAELFSVQWSSWVKPKFSIVKMSSNVKKM